MATPLRSVALSPSRAADFLRCPLLYRLRAIDRLPEPPSPAATRGTLVHSVLEGLFDRPAPDRTLEAAVSDIGPRWREIVARNESVTAMFADEAELAGFLGQVEQLLGTYFTLEAPSRLEPESRELRVEVMLEGEVPLRGFVDRVDVAPGSGAIRIVDYKTGKAPKPQYRGEALFQLQCYALALWRLRGQRPVMLQLLYLGDGQVVRYEPSEADLVATERKLHAVWDAIVDAGRSGSWPAVRGPLCPWCAHQSICPEFGGVPPTQPADTLARLGLPEANPTLP